MHNKKRLNINKVKKSISSSSNRHKRSICNEHIIWDFKYCDTKFWPFIFKHKKLLKKIKDVSNASIISIKRETHGKQGKSSNHYITNMSKLYNRARRRLRYLHLYDNNNFFSLRLNSKTRVYGFLYDNLFQVVWLDKDHEIYPTDVS